MNTQPKQQNALIPDYIATVIIWLHDNGHHDLGHILSVREQAYANRRAEDAERRKALDI